MQGSGRSMILIFSFLLCIFFLVHAGVGFQVLIFSFLLCVSFCFYILGHNCVAVGVGAIGVLSIL